MRLLAVVAGVLACGCGGGRIAELEARNDSLANRIERLTALNDSLDKALRRSVVDNERLTADVKFWQEQSDGWRVIAEGGPPGVSPRR